MSTVRRPSCLAGTVLLAAAGLLALLPGAGLQAQPVLVVDTVRAVQPWEPHALYTFPRLVMPDRPAMAARINHHLGIDFLEADPDTDGDRLFDRVWGDTVTGGMPRLNDLTWSVGRPLPQVLEVALEAEGCGAYCEGFTMHYLYDLRDGRHLAYDTLFTAEGLAWVDDTLHTLWAGRLNAYVAAQVDTLADTEIAPDHVARVRATLDLYRSCLEERPEHDPYVEDLSIVPGAVRFFIARCAGHVEQELDELDPVHVDLPFPVLWPRMRPGLVDLFRP